MQLASDGYSETLSAVKPTVDSWLQQGRALLPRMAF